MIFAPLVESKVVKRLPIPVWLPNDSISNDLFWQIYGLNSICLLLVVTIAGINDLLFTFFLIILCEQMDIVSQRLIKIPTYFTSAKSKNISNLEIGHVEHRLFIDCIRKHQNIYLYVIVSMRLDVISEIANFSSSIPRGRLGNNFLREFRVPQPCHFKKAARLSTGPSGISLKSRKFCIPAQKL